MNHMGKQIWKWIEKNAECLKAITLHNAGFDTKEHVQGKLAGLEICTQQISVLFKAERERKGCMLGLTIASLDMQEKITKFYVGNSRIKLVRSAINLTMDAIEQEKIKYDNE